MSPEGSEATVFHRPDKALLANKEDIDVFGSYPDTLISNFYQ